jgi:hypothetical protein
VPSRPRARIARQPLRPAPVRQRPWLLNEARGMAPGRAGAASSPISGGAPHTAAIPLLRTPAWVK